MRLIKMLGIAAIAAAAVMALIGAGTASATSLCKALPTGASCNAGTEYALPQTIEASTPEAVLTAAEFEVKCASTTTVVAEKKEGTEIIGKVTNLAFSSCKGTCSGAKANNLPYKGLLVGETDGNGFLTASNLLNGNPNATLTGCFGFASCSYGTALAKLSVKGGEPIKAIASKITLERTSGALCPASGTWSGTYSATSSNKNMWVAKT